MREKYVEERFPRYMIFGRDPKSGKVDVSSVDRDIVTKVCEDEANYLIDERDKIVTFLWKLADAFDKANPEEFKKFWYG
jgi:hypothetical protein